MTLPLVTALACVTFDPARIVGVKAGSLFGAAADICAFEPVAEFQVSRRNLRSQDKNTPVLGHWFPGRVRHTLIDGHLAFDGTLG